MKALDDISPAGGSASIQGLPYQFRGDIAASGKGDANEPLANSDCSSFVANWMAKASGNSVKLPDLTDAMVEQTHPVDPKDAQPLDLLFYQYPGQGSVRYGHVAILADKQGDNPAGWKVLDQSTDPSGPTGKAGVDIRTADHPLRNGGTMIIRRVPDQNS